MTPESQRMAIAEACGWKNPNHPDTQALVVNWWSKDRNVWWLMPDGKSLVMNSSVPDYLSDLNAMHEAWETLNETQKFAYRDHLIDVVSRCVGNDWYEGATAPQRAEAFLRTLGKWES
jgi:hypothetical protein